MAATTPLTAAEQEPSSCDGDAAAVPAQGFAGRLLALLTCRRRAKELKIGSPPSVFPVYEALRKHGQELSDDQKAAFGKMAWWSKSETKMGAKVFVLAPRGPHGDTECHIDMRGLLAYTVDQMHDHVVKQGALFAVVWVMFSDHRVWPLSAWSFKKHLHERYARCLDAVHVVHPSWSVRLLRLALWPYASDALWDHFECHERVEFLDSYMNLKTLALPADVLEYDKFLDRQAEEATQNAGKQMNGGWGQHGVGGMGSTGAGVDAAMGSKQYKEQMENLEKLLSEKGYGGKKSD